LFIALGLLALSVLPAKSAGASGLRDPGPPQARPTYARYACVPSLIWSNPELCPNYGPGATAYRIASIHLPDPLPELPVLELPRRDDEDILPHTYAYVKTLPLDIYHHPVEAAMGLPPIRSMLSGDWWVSVEELVEYNGQQWYRINEDEYVVADVLSLAGPSRFQGIYLNEQPQQPFAWINRWVQPSLLPQGEINDAVEALRRYQLVTIFAEERRGAEIWYLVGPDQWVEQENVSRVDVDPPPQEVASGGKWIEIDLFEQTVAAYEGDRMVYATLTSSGRSHTATPPGIYRLWAKIREGKMSNPDVEDGSPAWYYLEDVPWTMYFHEGYSLHAAYWHDAFGFTRSHGCVNLAPRDAEWLFGWADPFISEEADEVYIGEGAPNTWVWVHFTPPFD
jgi:hypothetical protein